jgi:hypothetical protein
MKLREASHFLPGNGVPDENDSAETEFVQNSCYVRDERIQITRWRRTRRCAEPAASDTKDVISIGESRSERIEDVRCVPKAREKHKRRATTTPVDDFQDNAGIDVNELASGLVGITSLRGDGLTDDRDAHEQNRQGSEEQTCLQLAAWN